MNWNKFGKIRKKSVKILKNFSKLSELLKNIFKIFGDFFTPTNRLIGPFWRANLFKFSNKFSCNKSKWSEIVGKSRVGLLCLFFSFWKKKQERSFFFFMIILLLRTCCCCCTTGRSRSGAHSFRVRRGPSSRPILLPPSGSWNKPPKCWSEKFTKCCDRVTKFP